MGDGGPALAGVAKGVNWYEPEPEDRKAIAGCAYGIADAMIEERERAFNNGGRGLAAAPQPEGARPVYTGERRDLAKLFGCAGMADTFKAVSGLIRRGGAHDIRPGDFMTIPVRLPAGRCGGLEFGPVDIKETELVVSHVFAEGRVAFQFEEVLFTSAVNPKNTNDGGFAASALAEYLNRNVENIFGAASEFLAESNDGLKITLPTQYEVFGEEEKNAGAFVNWSESPARLDWFRKRKNRIRVKGNELRRWWLSTASGPAAFCLVYSGGHAGNYGAGYYGGGAAPAICVS